MDFKSVLTQLQTARPIFHSEADFQHALAWEIHHQIPNTSVRLEINLGTDNPAIVDILIRDGPRNYAIELKYKVRKLDVTFRGEEFHLRNHGTQDIGRYDFVKDICRLETFVVTHPNTIGYAMFLTNDPNYWRKSKRPGTADTMFRLHDACSLGGALQWGAAAGKGTMKGREAPLDLKNSYSVRWNDYSELDCEGPGKFRYVLLRVDPPIAKQTNYPAAQVGG